MAIKKRILRRPGKGGPSTAPSKAVLAVIGCDDVRTKCALALRIGVEQFDDRYMTLDEAVAEAERLWKTHRVAATRLRIEMFPGTRPEHWWRERGDRPPVAPRDWSDANDGERFERERNMADLQYLRVRKLLTKEETKALTPKETVGPEVDDEII